MKRPMVAVIVIVVAAAGVGIYWVSRRAGSGPKADAEQAAGAGVQPGGGVGRAGGHAAADDDEGEPRIAAVGPRGQPPDELQPRHHTPELLRANPVRAAGRREELLRTIRKAGEEPPGAEERGKAKLGKEEIRAAIKAVTPLVAECYDKRLAQKEGLAGKAVVKFTIVAKDGQGRLDEGEIKSSTLDDLRLDTCMLHALTKARFPVPQGEGKVTVHYPFKFRPSGKKGGRR